MQVGLSFTWLETYNIGFLASQPKQNLPVSIPCVKNKNKMSLAKKPSEIPVAAINPPVMEQIL